LDRIALAAASIVAMWFYDIDGVRLARLNLLFFGRSSPSMARAVVFM
jgi:hypothetical protein